MKYLILFLLLGGCSNEKLYSYHERLGCYKATVHIIQLTVEQPPEAFITHMKQFCANVYQDHPEKE